MYIGERYLGCIKKEFSFFKPKFNIDCNGWHVDGDWLEWDYAILNNAGQRIASVSKELWNWTDTYTIDVCEPRDALCALMLVIAIDAEKMEQRNLVVDAGNVSFYNEEYDYTTSESLYEVTNIQ